MQANKKLKWDFQNKKSEANKIVALRVRFMNIHNPLANNEMFIKIPDGGRCEYSPLERTFYVFDSDDDMFRNVQAPEDSAIDISYVGKDYLDFLDLTNPESFHPDILN